MKTIIFWSVCILLAFLLGAPGITQDTTGNLDAFGAGKQIREPSMD